MIYPPLYKRAVNGKISQWTIEIEEDHYRTISGYTDGIQTTSEWTYASEKNVGKSNKTTAEQQAQFEVDALYRKRQEMGFFPNIKDCDKKVFYAPMLAHKWEDYEGKIKYPVFSQPKLDGVRCIVKSDGMWSRNGKLIKSAPHIFDSLKSILEKHPDMILDGELYAERDVADFNTIISCVRKTKPKPEDLLMSANYIKYHIYDLPHIEDVFYERFLHLCGLQLPNTCVIVDTFALHEKDEVKEKLNIYLEQGYEGQIIRLNEPYENKRSKSLLKHKIWVEEEFKIIGVEEGRGNLTGKVGKLIFDLPHINDTFDSAVNGGWEYLEKLFKKKDLIGKTATVRFFDYTPAGKPRFPKVIEIRDYE